MRLISPMFAGLATRPFRVSGRDRLGYSVLSAWSLAGTPLGVQDLWPRFMRASGGLAVVDSAIPKSMSEYLLLGHAYSLEPTGHVPVSVELRGQRKVINVIGDRYWRNGVPIEPEPFTKMPLAWSHAFGGPGFAHNPLGRGFVDGDPEGAPLPNLELPGQMIRSPHDRPAPAGFGAFGPDWPQRTRGLGTYDKEWFENDFPGFARDTDWRVHNVASEDQRFEHPFAPGERGVLHNLVDGRPRVELSIPRVAARCFVYRAEDAMELQEVPLSLRTLWMVPDEDMFILVFQGAHEITTMLGSEIKGVLLALDDAARLRDVDHFGRVLRQRLDPALGTVEMFDDRPLMPDGMEFPDFHARAEDLTLPDRPGALRANLEAGAERRRQQALALFREAGFEGAEALFPPPAPPEASNAPLTDRLRDALAAAEEKRKEGEAKLLALRDRAKEQLASAGLDPTFLEKRRAGPPPVLAATRVKRLEEMVRESRAAGAPIDFLEKQLADGAFRDELAESERRGREGYRVSGHHIEELPEVTPDRATAARTMVEGAIRARSSLRQADLTAVDLSELDLSGMDLTGAWLEGANLQGANLTGARLDDAVLAKADLADAVLSGTSLSKANLGRARLLRTRVESCNLGQAILDSADLRGVTFVRSNLEGADLANVRTRNTAFTECDLGSIVFLRMSLAEVRFHACTLDDCNFIEVTMDGASFQSCRLEKAAFVTCAGKGAVFYEAGMANTRFVSKCTFDECDFRRATMAKSTLRSCSFERSMFDEADLSECDLSQARFAGARFYRADMRHALATDSDLRSAMMAGANLMFAVLQGSDIRGTDLQGTNLFSADLALVRADTATSLEGALVTRVRHRPLWSAPT